MALEFETMEKLRQFYEQQEQSETRTPTQAERLAERRQQLAERRQQLAERKQAQQEREQAQREAERQEAQKKKNDSKTLLFCLISFLSILIEVIFCFCIILKY